MTKAGSVSSPPSRRLCDARAAADRSPATTSPASLRRRRMVTESASVSRRKRPTVAIAWLSGELDTLCLCILNRTHACTHVHTTHKNTASGESDTFRVCSMTHALTRAHLPHRHTQASRRRHAGARAQLTGEVGAPCLRNQVFQTLAHPGALLAGKVVVVLHPAEALCPKHDTHKASWRCSCTHAC